MGGKREAMGGGEEKRWEGVWGREGVTMGDMGLFG